MGREDLKGLPLFLKIKSSESLTKACKSIWNRSWTKMVGLCETFGASLTIVITKRHSCGLAVQCCRHWLHLYCSHSITNPSGHCCFCCHSSEERIHFWGLQSWFECSNLPDSNWSSKDSGYSDFQLGVPMRPIRSQRKIDVSKRDAQESAVLWRALKHFIPVDYNALYYYIFAFGVSFWRTSYYFKGCYSPVSCQMLGLSAIWWSFVINSSRIPFNYGHHNHSCRRWDWESKRDKAEPGSAPVTHT